MLRHVWPFSWIDTWPREVRDWAAVALLGGLAVWCCYGAVQIWRETRGTT